VVARPIGSFRGSSDYHYQTLRCNVDLLRIIQLGITLADENGELAPGVCTWQFNFSFSIKCVRFSPTPLLFLVSRCGGPGRIRIHRSTLVHHDVLQSAQQTHLLLPLPSLSLPSPPPSSFSSRSDDMYAPESIELLTKSGINFKRHEEYGIDVEHFGELLISSGLVLLDEVQWVSFHRCAGFSFFSCRLSSGVQG
jgi:hypothetical protein